MTLSSQKITYILTECDALLIMKNKGKKDFDAKEPK